MGRETNRQRRAASQQSARERAATMRLEQQRRERRRRMLTIGGITLGILAVVGIVIGIGVGGSSSGGGKSNALTAAEEQGLHVSPAAFAAVGTAKGVVVGTPQKAVAGSPPLTSNGKPEVLYIGAEFCPYCAAERWALSVALNRFGSLSSLQTMHSSPTDVDKNTPTVTYRNASYSSQYIAFKPIENEDINHKPLQSVDSADNALWKKYTYSCSQGVCGTGYPFIDFGGKAVITGPSFDPAILSGLSQKQIINDLKDPNNQVTKGILGAANYMTAAICQMTGNKPANVCTSSVTKLAASFPQFTSTSGSGSSANSGSASNG